VLHSASFHIAVGQETDQSVKLGVVGEKSRCDDPERGAEPADGKMTPFAQLNCHSFRFAQMAKGLLWSATLR
jgi:hypothetical protein